MKKTLKSIRLSNEDLSIIIKSFKESFLTNDSLWIFGSRVHKEKKGGDVDLYVKTNLNLENAELARQKLWLLLQNRLGEQKIDIVVHYANSSKKTIYDVAQNEGIQLL